MRRRVADVAEVNGIPAELLLGACIEVWAPELRPAGMSSKDWKRRRSFVAFRRHRQACCEFLERAGLTRASAPAELGIGSSIPWSFEFVARTQPDFLVDRLHRAGLPADWAP